MGQKRWSAAAGRWIIVLLAVAAVYFVAGRLGVMLAIPPGVASPVWLPSGVATAAVLLWGSRVWPGIWLGSFCVNAGTLFTSGTPTALAVSLSAVAAIATGSTLQALLVGYLVRRWIGPHRIFERVQGVLGFTAVVVASCLVAATVGATALTVSGFAPWTAYGATWLTWWLGDLIGILLVAPLALMWRIPGPIHWRLWRLLEAAALLLLLILIGQVVFGSLFPAGRGNRPLPNLLAPLIVWAAIRFGPRGVVLTTALISAMAIRGSLLGWGPFGAGPLHVALLWMQIFMGVALVTSLLLAAAFSERRGAEERFHALADATPVMVWQSGLDRRCYYFNRAWLEFTGRALEEELGDGWTQGVHPEDLARCRNVYNDAFEHRAPFEMEYRLRHRSGQYRWLLDRGTPRFDASRAFLGYIGGCIDIDDRKRAEEARRAAESQVRLITDAVPALISYVDAEFRYRLNNQTYQRWFGQDPAQIQGRHVREVLGEAAWDAVRPHMERALEGEVVTYEQELPYRGGGPRWVNVTYTPDRGEDGRVRGFVVLVHDVSEAKRAEDALREANAQQAEAARRKDEFLAMLAHELRNPLAPIRYAAQMLSLSGVMGKMKKQCELIDRQVSHMGRLLDDLLDVSRITQGKIQLRREIIDLRGVVEQAVDSLRPMIEGRGQHLGYQGSTTPMPVDGDPTRLEQVVRNLLHNANKYTEEGGCIGVSAGLEIENENAGWAAIYVRDSGVGIPPEILGQVFEPFVQAAQSLARTQGGLGIGLAMVKRLVQMHGGHVEALSAGVGFGSEFIVRLPLVQPMREEQPGSETQSARVVGASAGPCRVLVVEDNSDAAASLSELLDLWGYEVRTAYDGNHALAAARQWRPEVILLDIGLPGIDGYEVAKRLRQDPVTTGAFIVALTGYGADDDRRRAQDAGVNLHLTKPVELERLQAVLSGLRAA